MKEPCQQKSSRKPANQKIIDWNLVDRWLEAGCSGTEIAAGLGVHPDTLYNRCQEERKTVFSAYAQQKRAKGDVMLHSKQFEISLTGNVPMLIWLGKQRLNQREPEPKTVEACKPALLQYLELLNKNSNASDQKSENI
jgi:hypothetical protein